MNFDKYALAQLEASGKALGPLRHRFDEFFKFASQFFEDAKCPVKGVSMKQSGTDVVEVSFATVVIRLRLQLSTSENVRSGRVVVFLDEPSFGQEPRRLQGFRFNAKGEIDETTVDGMAASMGDNAVDVVAHLLNAALAAGVPSAQSK